MFYVTFIITNTYGKDVNLRSSLASPFDDITIVNGQTVRLTIKVPTQQDVTFEAFVKESGERISVNGKDAYSITPRENSKKATVLRIPEFSGTQTQTL